MFVKMFFFKCVIKRLTLMYLYNDIAAIKPGVSHGANVCIQIWLGLHYHFFKCTSAWKKKIHICHMKINLLSFFWNLLKSTNETLFLCSLQTIKSSTIHHISLLYFSVHIHLPSLNLMTGVYLKCHMAKPVWLSG